MDPYFESAYVTLFQITSILLMPGLMCLSVSRSLRIAPSRFSHVAIFNFFRTQRLVNAAWLVIACIWYVRWVSTFGELANLSDIRYLMISVGVLLIFTTTGQQWTHWVLVPELGDSRASVDAEEEVLVQIDGEGYFQSSYRDPDLSLAIAPGRVSGAIAIHASLSIFALTLLCILAEALGAFADIAILIFLLVLAGLWLSLQVLVMDLSMDTWPGAATIPRLRRTTIYYVQVFEQWVIPAILVGLIIVMVLGPVASFKAYVPGAVASFAVWGVLCILFAAGWNKLLYDKGRVPTALPFPMQVNRYSANHPAWAYFVTIIHIGMVLCLALGIVVMNR